MPSYRNQAIACLYNTWTDAADANENRPINCITWFEAMAFCIWDGGYLPTEAEWSPLPACPGVIDVGTKPLGDGRFGQSDLAGNVWEPTLDAYVYQYPTPCTDCASVKGEDFHVFRGGSARDTVVHLRTSRRDLFGPRDRARDLGVRCARAP